jgi:hypothetical protein
MSFWLLRAEWMGVLFWVTSLLFMRRGQPAFVVVWHLIGAGLSLAAPVLLALRAQQVPLGMLASVCLLGAFNGVLGAFWCGRVDPPVPKLPMLSLTAAGLAGAVLLTVTAATPTRLF